MTPAEEKQLAVLNESLSKEIQIELIRTDHVKSPKILKGEYEAEVKEAASEALGKLS